MASVLRAPESSLARRAAARLARRRGFRLARLVLVLVTTLAVYAPFLASDRPLYLVAVHRGEYERALRTLAPVAEALAGLLGRSEAEHLAARGPGSTQGLHAARAAEAEALEVRLDTLARSLAPEQRAPVEALVDAIAGALAAAEEGRGAEATRAGAALVEGGRALRASHDPARVTLVPRRSFPVFEALTPLEVGVGGAWFMLLALSLARRRWRPRLLALAATGCGVLGGVAWSLAVGGGEAFHSSSFKTELVSGALEARRVVFTPVPYGFAEQHAEESLRPPTWLAVSELDARGAYMRGARVPVADPVTGFVPVTRAVEVRAGEPALNAPWRHLLGTDTTGRDLLARAIHGARASLMVGGLAALLLFVLGVAIGALAGTLGGWLDLLLSRLIEVVASIPLLFLVLVAVAFLGPSLWNVVLVLGCVGWTGIARLARTEFQRERELDYVSAARALGCSWPRIMLVHMLPNALAPLLVAATFAVAGAILVESALSFLGYGVRVPVASWGGLSSESRDLANWWLQLFPGLFLFVTVLSVQLVGDALRDALDPRADVAAGRGA